MSEKKKILVVDDDTDCREQVAMMLEGDKYEVTTASSRAEGEEMLLTIQPDAAIFDLMMEEQDSGFMLCHTTKTMYPKTKVVLLTSVTAVTGLSFHKPTSGGGNWIDADLLLDKPVRPEQLQGALEKLLEA